MIGERMNDGLFIAQINFILGRVYNIKQEYDKSILYHDKHLNLAQQYQDLKGQYQGYFILSQLYDKVNQYEKSKKYLNLYKTLSKESDGKNHLLKVNQYDKILSKNILLFVFFSSEFSCRIN